MENSKEHRPGDLSTDTSVAEEKKLSLAFVKGILELTRPTNLPAKEKVTILKRIMDVHVKTILDYLPKFNEIGKILSEKFYQYDFSNESFQPREISYTTEGISEKTRVIEFFLSFKSNPVETKTLHCRSLFLTYSGEIIIVCTSKDESIGEANEIYIRKAEDNDLIELIETKSFDVKHFVDFLCNTMDSAVRKRSKQIEMITESNNSIKEYIEFL